LAACSLRGAVGSKLLTTLVRILPVDLLGLVDPVDPAHLANLVDLGNLACLVGPVDLAEPQSLALLLRSIEGTGLSPCRLWNHRGKWVFHTDYRRIRRAGSGDRNIGLALELLLDRPY
jgi:hypothetical protein